MQLANRLNAVAQSNGADDGPGAATPGGLGAGNGAPPGSDEQPNTIPAKRTAYFMNVF
jgi:hypothetical protein